MAKSASMSARLAVIAALALGLILLAQAAWAQDAQPQTAPSAVVKNAAPIPDASPAPAYHGNTKSKRFHCSGCRYFYCKHCTAVFKTREEAIKAGYLHPLQGMQPLRRAVAAIFARRGNSSIFCKPPQRSGRYRP